MRTFIREITWMDRSTTNFGYGNGYVLLDENHPFHGKDYDEINEKVEVHYGLTFSELITPGSIEHYGLQKEDIGKWMIGFDTCHFDDTLEKWPKEKVQEEADNLLKQLETFL